MSLTADLIYLLDDEPNVLNALGRLLASDGLDAQKFSSPTRFLEQARSHPMRVAVIDIRMPGMSGLEVLAELRVISPDAKVIVMTGENGCSHRNAAMAGGANAFFFKPFDAEQFLAAVRAGLVAED